MHPKKKQRISRGLFQIAQETEVPEVGRSQVKTRHGEDGSFSLRESTYRDYIELGKIFLDEGDWGSKFSENYIHAAMDRILVKVGRQPKKSDIEQLVDRLVEELSSYSDEVTVYVPIHGLSMDMECLEIGNIVFRAATDEFLKRLPHRKLKPHRAGVFAEYHTVAENTRAVERALAECQRVLDLFWLFVPFSRSRDDSRWHISIEEIQALGIDILTEEGFHSFNYQRRFLPFHLRGDVVREMRQMGIFEVGDLLRKPERSLSDFERTLMRGIHWYATARAQTQSENEFINLIICLESFFTPKDGAPIAASIAEGVALCLSEDFSERVEIRDKLKNLYGMRSGISHGGRKAIPDSDLMWLREGAWYAVEWMIKNRTEFSSRDHLHNWIEKKKLGGA